MSVNTLSMKCHIMSNYHAIQLQVEGRAGCFSHVWSWNTISLTLTLIVLETLTLAMKFYPFLKKSLFLLHTLTQPPCKQTTWRFYMLHCHCSVQFSLRWYLWVREGPYMPSTPFLRSFPDVHCHALVTVTVHAIKNKKCCFSSPNCGIVVVNLV